MNNPICRKVMSLLSLYIDDKLDDDEKYLVESHLLNCGDCYKKYLEMKEMMDNLHFEYAKLLNEFERIEANKMFNIREYEVFFKNISPYIDDELCYDDSIKFRKYLLKSKFARSELACAYNLKNKIRNSVENFKDAIKINFSRKVLNRLNSENKDSFDNIYKKAAVLIGVMVFVLIVLSIYVGFSYLNKSFADDSVSEVIPNIEFPSDDNLTEFTFDENNQIILVDK